MKNLTNTQSDFENEQKDKIIFDYGGPNIGKPLHVGHMRTLNIGRSLYNIHSFVGNEVVSDIHLGDWGMPIAQIITYLEKKVYQRLICLLLIILKQNKDWRFWKVNFQLYNHL